MVSQMVMWKLHFSLIIILLIFFILLLIFFSGTTTHRESKSTAANRAFKTFKARDQYLVFKTDWFWLYRHIYEVQDLMNLA